MARCAFCDRIATMSGEHIWSEWINDLLGPTYRGKFTFRRVAEDGTTIGATWTDDQLNWKANVVCEPCNNDWMSDLENNHAKPTLSGIILGRPVSLLPLGIASLAAFAFKMAVVSDHMASHRTPFFLPSVRKAFRRSLRIPSKVQMWFAAFHEPGERRGLLRSYYVNVSHGRYGNFQYFVATYGISPFLLQVVSRRWTKPLVGRRAPVPRLIQNAFWKDIPEFWPPSRNPLSWPPAKYLGSDMLKTFVDRWTKLQSDI